tara:strand:- start:111 stop:287 length:177 start_codon:yes stop_codon:yes gene_type:complete
MAFTYKLLADRPTELGGGKMEAVQRIEDGAFIPFDPDNKDYQEYLEWVAEGNTAEAAD